MVKIGIIGIGNIGTMHAKNFIENRCPNSKLVAICDIDSDKLNIAKENFGEEISYFENPKNFFSSQMFDAVIIATYHYSHPTLAIEALENNYHVLVEKPIGVYTKAVKKLYEVAKTSDKIFGIMYNQRTNPLYQKLKDLVESGELGEIRRTNWIITDWYRNQVYYDSSTWRATWAGEGGGVLLNQSPHQLDLWQWICGMPNKIRGFCHFGHRRDIEVEDTVTAYVEYENGATGTFISTTTETPGTNRFEIVGDKGKVVVEDEKILFWRLRESETSYNERLKTQKFSSDLGFSQPECWKCEIPVEEQLNSQHVDLINNWISSIKTGSKLLAPGLEGINGLTISNAIYLSEFTDSWVTTPLNEDLFLEKLKEKVKTSKINNNLDNLS